MRVAARVGQLAALAAGGLAYSIFEARWYALRWATAPAAPPGAVPLRILHLSDLHLLSGQRRVVEFLTAALDAGPDLVVATGDLLGDPEAIDEAVAALEPLADGRPAVFTLGSNDFYGPTAKSPSRYLRPDADHRVLGVRMDTGRLVDGLVDVGWTCAENRRVVVDTAAGPLEVLGLGDAHIGHDRPEALQDSGTRREARDETMTWRLGVAHAPYLRVLDALAAAGADLVLAGHTHGGQLRVPLYGALVDNCDLPLSQARGLSADRPGMWLHVSAGLGTNRYTPVRFACRPEATIVDVVARPAGGAAHMASRAGSV